MARMWSAERELKKAGMNPRWDGNERLGVNRLCAKYGDVAIEVYGYNCVITAIRVRRESDVDDPAENYVAGAYARDIAQAIQWAKEWRLSDGCPSDSRVTGDNRHQFENCPEIAP